MKIALRQSRGLGWVLILFSILIKESRMKWNPLLLVLCSRIESERKIFLFSFSKRMEIFTKKLNKKIVEALLKKVSCA